MDLNDFVRSLTPEAFLALQQAVKAHAEFMSTAFGKVISPMAGADHAEPYQYVDIKSSQYSEEQRIKMALARYPGLTGGIDDSQAYISAIKRLREFTNVSLKAAVDALKPYKAYTTSTY